MLRWVISLLCVGSLLGCSLQSTLPAPGAGAFSGASEGQHGSVRLVDDEGATVHLRPRDTLAITFQDGETTRTTGELLCLHDEGLSLRGSGGSCAEARWLASWEEIQKIEVEQFDGASSVAITIGAAVLVVGAIVAIVASEGKAGKGSSSTPKTSRQLASPSTGGSPKPAAPAPAPRGPSPAVGSPRGSAPSHRYRHGPVFGPRLVILPSIDVSSSSGGSVAVDSGEVPGGSSPLVDGGQPLFSDQASRRSRFLPVLRGEVGGCLGSEPCSYQSLRLGAVVMDLVEFSGGLRWEQLGGRSSLAAVLGLGLQGRFPRYPSLALALATQVTVGDRTRITPQAGLRWNPGDGFWLGLQPLAVTFLLPEERVAYTPSLELGYSF